MNSYKIWIISFTTLNLLLLGWSLDYVPSFLNNKNDNNKTLIISPEKSFLKIIPPEDKSFPNESSKVWNAFKESDKSEMEKSEDNYNLEKENKKSQDNGSRFIKEADNSSSIISSNDAAKDQSLKGTNQIDINLKESNLKKNDKLNNDENKTLVKKKNKQINEKKAKNNNLSFYVQVASLSKKELVEVEWKRLNKKYASYLSELTYKVEEIKLKNNKTFYRLLVGAHSDKANATMFCKKILIGNNCIIKQY